MSDAEGSTAQEGGRARWTTVVEAEAAEGRDGPTGPGVRETPGSLEMAQDSGVEVAGPGWATARTWSPGRNRAQSDSREERRAAGPPRAPCEGRGGHTSRGDPRTASPCGALPTGPSQASCHLCRLEPSGMFLEGLHADSGSLITYVTAPPRVPRCVQSPLYPSVHPTRASPCGCHWLRLPGAQASRVQHWEVFQGEKNEPR